MLALGMSAGTVIKPPPPFEAPPAAWLTWANELHNFVETGLRCLTIERGSCEVVLEESPWSLNPNGAVNGGLCVAAADQVAGLVALTAMPTGSLPATATLHAEYLRPAFAPLTLRGSVAQRGRRLVFVAVDVFDSSGRLCVRCTGTMAEQRDG